MEAELTLTALEGLPLFVPGDDLVVAIRDGITRTGEKLADGDVLYKTNRCGSRKFVLPDYVEDCLPDSHPPSL